MEKNKEKDAEEKIKKKERGKQKVERRGGKNLSFPNEHL